MLAPAMLALAASCICCCRCCSCCQLASAVNAASFNPTPQVLDATKAFKKLLTDKADVEGLPESGGCVEVVGSE